MRLLRLIDKRKPFIKLGKVTETESKQTWIFTFVDPLHKFIQSIILVKTDDAGEKMEAMMETLYCRWQDKINENEINLILGKSGREN